MKRRSSIKNSSKMKLVGMLLIMAMVLSLLGCGKEQDNQKDAGVQSFQQVGEQSQQAGSESTVDTSDIEIREIAEREWEEKAVVTLGDSVTIEGNGAEVVENIISISQGGSYEIT